jgi:mono/diheme cytochrome c family protein
MRNLKLGFIGVELAFALVICVVFTTPSGYAQQSGAAETSPDAPGLTLTFENPKGTGKPDFPDTRISRLVALHVPQGTSPSPFTPADPFRATFEGDITVRLRTFARFSAMGRGKLTLSIGGKRVLESSGEDLSKITSEEIRLGKGKNHVVAVYESPQDGDASLRLFWSSKTWQPEPVPRMLFSHATTDPGVAKSLVVREGRFLFAQFRCLNCHSDEGLRNPGNKEEMPELGMDVPSLADAGARFNEAWLAAWVAKPQAVRVDAHMPGLFSRPGADAIPKDIAAYLASLGKETRAATSGKVSEGGRLFANLDCVACHTAPGGTEDAGRIPLSYVSAKYKPNALREYLLHPDARYAWNPMPDFHLGEQEAGDIAAFLLSTPSPVLPEVHGDAAKGKLAIESAGCLNCHRLGDEKTVAQFPSLRALTAGSLEKGCLAGDVASRGKAPDFGMPVEQRAALTLFLKTDRASLSARCAPEFAERQIPAMRCTACHSRDGNESLLAQKLDAESQALHQKYPNPPVTEHDLLAADQRPPLLTWVGEKLRPQWMSEFIGGQISYKPRYYLRARMPAFRARAELLATGLAQEHGCPSTLPPNTAPDSALSEIGRKLCGKTPNEGFSCVQCHSVGDTLPFAAFEAPSINLKYISDRLRHDYYLRWITDPQRVDPNAKMPKYGDDEGKTGLPIFDNNASRQFEAIWQYLLEGKDIKPPPG